MMPQVSTGCVSRDRMVCKGNLFDMIDRHRAVGQTIQTQLHSQQKMLLFPWPLMPPPVSPPRQHGLVFGRAV